MPFYIFAWIASIFYGFEVIIGKLVSKYQVSNAWLFNFIWSLFILLLTTPIALINQATLPNHWLNLILAALFYAASNIGYLTALKKLEVSIISPLSNLRTPISILLGVILLGESYSLEKVLIVIFIVVASLFVTIDERLSLKTFFEKSNLWMILVLFSLSLMSIFINLSVSENGFWTVTLWMPLIAQILFLGTFPLWKKDFSRLSGKHYGGMFLMAVFGAIGTTAANKAFAGNVGISTVIMSLPLSMLAAILLSFLAPKLLEKHSTKIYLIRMIAAAAMIAGTIKLTM